MKIATCSAVHTLSTPLPHFYSPSLCSLHRMAKCLWRPGPHTRMWFFPKLLPPSWKHTNVQNVLIRRSFRINGQTCSSMTASLDTKRAPWRLGSPRLEWKILTGLHRSLSPTPLNTLGMTWNTKCLLRRHEYLISWMLLLPKHGKGKGAWI